MPPGKNERRRFTRLFFVTDIHGSEETFSKFVRAKQIYGVDVLLLSGDLTGKLVIPIVKQADDTYTSNLMGQEWKLNKEEVANIQKRIETMGFYWYMTDRAGAEKLTSDLSIYDEVYKQLSILRLRHWINMIDQRALSEGFQIYVTTGNDDPPYVRDVLKTCANVVDTEDSVVLLDETHEMISLGFSNPTPWKTPRECSEDELTERIESACSQVKNMKNCLFNFHIPPKDSGLDTATKVDQTLKADMREIIGAGSTSVRKAIETHQPLLGLHGHIHESRGTIRIGRTLCINPGSEYAEGILRGAIVSFDQEKIRGHQFTSG